jgi:murein DD-endopeptidase MepM/ murein hydrolase activator NlpD
LRSRPHAYAGRAGALRPEIYASDHADGRRTGRFRWVLSTCLAAAVGALAILVAVAGSMDADDSNFAGLEDRLRQASLALRLPTGRADGLRWAVPKTDKMQLPKDAVAQKSLIPEPVKEKRGQREYTLNRYYVRLVARLGPVAKADAAKVPQFDPLSVYASTAPVGGRAESQQETAVPTKLIELNGTLAAEDGQELEAQEVLAIVQRAQAADAEVATSSPDLLAGSPEGLADTLAPQTTVLPKTVFETDTAEEAATRELAPNKGQDNSIYASIYHLAATYGIPDDMILQVLRIHAPLTDFRQRVRAGDGFELFFDLKDQDKGVDGAPGDLLATFITAGGETRKYYRFRSADGVVDFYDADGNTARKFLMRLPVRARDIRLTSGYGMRMHPLLRISKMHAGEDWACAQGTPIMAAGSGIIEEAGPKGENGNYIRIKHANGYKTGYAHMVGFASGIAVGVKVRQGQIIGYVGSTGLSSGPHVHFEVWIKNQHDSGYHHVNPGAIPIPNERQLKGKDLADFRRERARIDNLMRAHPVRSAQLRWWTPDCAAAMCGAGRREASGVLRP